MSDDLMRGLAVLDERREGYLEAERMYEGKQAEVFNSVHLKRLIGKTGEKMRVHFAATPVDAIADRLEISSITGTRASDTKAVERIWDDNQLDLHMPEILRKAGVFGDAYTIVWAGEDGEVTIDYNSPLTTVLIYDVENPRLKSFAVKRWEVRFEGKKRLRANVYYADRLDKFITHAGADGSKATDWAPFSDEEGGEGSIPNPWGLVPVFHFRNSSLYGVPDHIRAYGPQRAIDKTIAAMTSTTDYAAWPQRYGLTDAKVDTDDADDLYDDDDYSGASRPADNQGRQPQQDSQLKAGPGKLWTLAGMKEVGQFEAADPKHFLAPIEFYVRAMAVTTHTPLHEFDPQGDQPSGESRRTAEMPLVKRVNNRKLWYGATLREMFEFCLAILNVTTQIQVTWKAAASVDDSEGVAVAKGKQEIGVPQDQVLLELGYTPEQLDDWGDAIDEGELRRRVALLAELGNAVQRLGAGAALGVISPEAVRAVMDKYLGLTQGDTEPADQPDELSDEAINDLLSDRPENVPAPSPAAVPSNGGAGGFGT